MSRVIVYRAFEGGELRAVGLTEDAVVRLCPEARDKGWSIQAAEEDVPDARGVVTDWNQHGGSARGPKVHWNCPCCGGREHWSDFAYADTNPALWFCWEGGGRICLVQWDHESAVRAIATPDQLQP
jgi:hypothetical protein